MKKIPVTVFLPAIVMLVTIGYVFFQNAATKSSTGIKQPTPTTTTVPAVSTEPTTAQKIAYVSPAPTLIPTAIPPNTPTPTISPCGLGVPSRANPDSSVSLNSISPTSAKVGETIILKGSGFGKSSFFFPNPQDFKGGVSFYGSCGYNSGSAPPAETGAGWWSDETIKVKVPGVSPGNFQVEVMSSDGKRSNRINFEVLN